MANDVEVTADLKKLNKFIKDLGEQAANYQVKIGIFANKSARKQKGEMTNPQLGIIHELGSKSRHIPPRSFLRMPLEMKSEDILNEVKSGKAWQHIKEGQIIPVLKDLGHACEAIIQLAFATRGFGTWAPDLISTIDRKTAKLSKKQRRAVGGYSNTPLIDTGQLRRSITSTVTQVDGGE